MFGERTPPERARTRSESGRSGRPSLPAVLAALLVTAALALLVLRARRGDEPTLEPPF